MDAACGDDRKRPREEEATAPPAAETWRSRCAAGLGVLPFDFVRRRFDGAARSVTARTQTRFAALVCVSATARHAAQQQTPGGVTLSGIQYTVDDDGTLCVAVSTRVTQRSISGLWWIGRFGEVCVRGKAAKWLLTTLEAITCVVGVQPDDKHTGDVLGCLSALPHLKHLWLSANLAGTATWLREAPTTLEFLKLDFLTSATGKTFAPSIARLTELRRLELGWCFGDIATTLGSSGALATFTKLTTLCVGGSIGPEFYPSLANLPNLTALTFTSMFSGITPNVAESAFAGLQQLRYLSWSMCSRYRETAGGILAGLERCDRLETVLLNNVPFGSDAAAGLARCLRQWHQLQRLSFRCCRLGPFFSVIAPELARLTDLRELELFGNRIDSAGASALTPSLAQLCRLEKLDLSGNKLLDAGVAAVCGSFRSLRNLRVLKFDNNEFSGTCIPTLAAQLPCLTLLRELIVVNNFLDGPGLGPALGQALAHLTRLESIALHFKSITVVDAEALAAAVPLMTSMRTFQVLSRTCLDEAADVLFAATVRCPQLGIVSLPWATVARRVGAEKRAACMRKDACGLKSF